MQIKLLCSFLSGSDHCTAASGRKDYSATLPELCCNSSGTLHLLELFLEVGCEVGCDSGLLQEPKTADLNELALAGGKQKGNAASGDLFGPRGAQKPGH